MAEIYRLLTSEYLQRWLLQKIAIQALIPIESPSDFRRLLLAVADTHMIDDGVIVKAYTRDSHGHLFFLNCLDRRHVLVGDLRNPDLQTILDEVITMQIVLNSAHHIEFDEHTTIEIQFFMCDKDGRLSVPRQFQEQYDAQYK